MHQLLLIHYSKEDREREGKNIKKNFIKKMFFKVKLDAN